MATATFVAVGVEVGQPWDTPGPTTVVLELDSNEADAVRHMLYSNGFTAKAAGRSTYLHPTSLIAAGARVHAALSGEGT
jgi:hypothetical protein